jgi:hypothetical protein
MEYPSKGFHLELLLNALKLEHKVVETLVDVDSENGSLF